MGFVDDLLYIQTIIPVILNRYRYSNQMIMLLRDRCILNNSLTSYEPYDGYGYNADEYYKEKSLTNEYYLVQAYQGHKPVVANIVDLA